MVTQDWLTVAEIAAKLRVNPVTVRLWIREGRLRGVQLGGNRAGYRISTEALQEFLDGNYRYGVR